MINKAKLDVLIALVREYWTNTDVETCKRRAERIIEFEETEMSKEIQLRDFIKSIIAAFGVKPDATNEDIYKVLEILGWEVK